MGKKCKFCALIVSLLGAVTASVDATPLNLTLMDAPDIFADYIDVDYDASADLFSALGFALTLDMDGVSTPVNIVDGMFDLRASVDDAGMLISPAGSLTIEGMVLGFGPNLLTATVTDFGFGDAGGDIFEFVLTVTGGDLATASMFGAPGAVMGVILNANGSNFTGSFATNFTNHAVPGTGLGVSDSAPIPEPASALLMGVAGLGALLRRRRAASNAREAS